VSAPLSLCVIGGGSIGFRHLSVAQALGCMKSTAVVKPQAARRAEPAQMGVPVVAELRCGVAARTGVRPILTNLSHGIDLMRLFAGEITCVTAQTSDATRGLAMPRRWTRRWIRRWIRSWIPHRERHWERHWERH